MEKSICKFNKTPTIVSEIIPDFTTSGMNNVIDKIVKLARSKQKVVLETYQGVNLEIFHKELVSRIDTHQIYVSESFFKSEKDLKEIVFPFVTDDEIFGFLTNLSIEDYFSDYSEIKKSNENLIVIGPGSSTLLTDYDLLLYFDIPRWEIQKRQRDGLVSSLGFNNTDDGPKKLYKQSFFLDWRVLDHIKKSVYEKADFVIDCSDQNNPKMIDGKSLLSSLKDIMERPFEMVPFFDPGVWGGEWMRTHFELDSDTPNFAWCFNCVPEENHIRIKIDGINFDIPAINLVFFFSREFLGNHVYQKFGAEFPIRFDFLDTLGGGNLSLQVHPTAPYIKEKFGVDYTQEESYYLLHAEPDTKVFLGLREDIQADQMKKSLETAHEDNTPFPVDQFIESWDVKTHDHLLIPPGTPHCSGKDTMVLEISATPYIFTFKMWDWGRVDLDGKPRPININHALNNIQWNRTGEWISENLVNNFEIIEERNGYVEERTGLHSNSFIETRRHWFSETVSHNTGGTDNGSVNVLNLVEGQQVLVESPTNAFGPFIVNYAETFVIPANVGAYNITPYGSSSNKRCATVKAYVRK